MEEQVRNFFYQAIRNAHKPNMDHEMLMYNVVITVAVAKVTERVKYPGDNP